MSEFIFVVGVGRSGTTLIQSMLNAHSSICFSQETHFIKRYLVPELAGKRNYDEVDGLINELLGDPDLNQFHPVLNKLKRPTDIKSSGCISSWVFKEMLRLHCNGDITYVGDKDPMNINYMPQIKSEFPNSKVIHIIRDPRDVVLSRVKSDWGKNRKRIGHIVEYDYSIRKGRKDGKNQFGSDYLEIKYEDLLNDPNAVLKGVCSFLNLEFETGMLQHHENSKELIKSDEMSWKSNVLQPILKDNIGKWKKELNTSDQKRLETWLYSVLKYTDYPLAELSGNWKTGMTTFLLKMGRSLISLKHG